MVISIIKQNDEVSENKLNYLAYTRVVNDQIILKNSKNTKCIVIKKKIQWNRIQ